MGQPLRWLWGLAPLALLWGMGNLALDDAIQHDVGNRAMQAASSAAGQAPGARPIVAQVVGRDVSIGGEALSADGAAKAMAQLRSEFGVRRALGGLSQAVAQRPYSWSAMRQGGVVTLSGSVPDEATATANVATAGAALPGLRIEDRQSLAFGAPMGFAEMTKTLLAELPKLSSGKVALDDGRFCIEGSADTPDAFLALKSAMPNLAKGGFQPVDCALEPPVVAPYRWSAERAADGSVAVTGSYPSEDVRRQLQALLRRSFPEPASLNDLTKPALGAPAAFLAKATRAIGDLARLRNGTAELVGDAYELTGAGPDDFEACQALRLLVAQLDGPDSVAKAMIACPPAPPPAPLPVPALSVPAAPTLTPGATSSPPASAPPASTDGAVQGVAQGSAPPAPAAPPVPAPAPVMLRWQAEKTEQGLVVTGLVRDEAARAALRAASGLANAGPLDDRTTVEPNLVATPDYASATRFAFELLGSMTRGTISLDRSELALSGDVADEAGLRALEAALARQPMLAGLSLKSGTAAGAFAVRPYGLRLTVDKSGVSMTGYLPDARSREDLLALVEASSLRGKVSDSTTLLSGAPAGFTAAAHVALVNLLRLDLGSASLSEDGAVIQGLTCRDLIKREVETSAATAEEPLKVSASVGLRQTGCVIDPPNTCQNDLDALTKRNTVLFGQGTAVVPLDPTTERVVNEAFAILKQCPASRVVIEGHANRDGEWRGFNNLDLSERRALRVRDELVRRGIDPAQLTVAGFGTDRPLVPHGAPDARVMNRRVQFTVAK
ncbi:outer membrane protein OmpA-like peptidoglycan-associated protein [Bosea sp. BE125]|uniref:OmpA family protein n=1 Tax=Bosea sp. BE125 TaxID=2817909 RepID=UPI00285FB000|nr:OmpA family protein [Bosea sp. BE125]MDR6870960.1 outer membrane protein OmpA-like peptidoglycan-associated protein [Bosea sp. BE125]